MFLMSAVAPAIAPSGISGIIAAAVAVLVLTKHKGSLIKTGIRPGVFSASTVVIV